LALLKTVSTAKESDGTGSTRQATLRDVITGWYSLGNNYSDDTSLQGQTQKVGWIPKGWRDVNHGGTLPVGTETLYTNTVAPYCRSCHFNREISLDFGTYANFHQESDLPAIGLIAQCKQSQPDKGAKFMPLAHLTFERYWQTQGGPINLPNITLNHEPDRLAGDFGFGSVSGYCATNP
jgi:hypothetical protein